ncbi:sialate O-acetylesterase [Rufibacter hautae]|uniref:Sialate O-acetylesterase n=1 Tax=Rufibacter hautae TaxID=2595005 RepID=A0A5B6TDP9_9BACT|nr:sialate O-acetylesterase [Rufibacter hautae]KAA3438597.1 sialate O-acetylesterase [Rufibacter hautae]
MGNPRLSFCSTFLRFTFLIILVATPSLVFGQVRLPKVFSDHMVLQRGRAIPVWGTAQPGKQISVEFGGQKIKTTTGQDGKWMVHLPQMKAGGPHLMQVSEEDKTKPVILFKDVLIGDVWLASRQSNMEWQVQQAMNAETEIKNAHYPNIRFFNVPHDKKTNVQTDVLAGSWQPIDSLTVKTASAVAYYFARELQADLKVPIGILQSTWGGTPVEAWISREQLLSSPITQRTVLQNDTVTEKHFLKDSLDLVRFWDIVYNPKNKTDKTIPNPNYNDAKWPELVMPATLKNLNLPGYEGMMWLRKTIHLPQNLFGKEVTLHFGHPEMNYSLYFNGKEIAKNVWNAKPTHHYRIPANLVKQGKNVIAVRMAFLWTGGGFNPPAEEMYLTDGTAKLSLAGGWKYRKDLEPTLPTIKNYHQFPTYLFNAMINPVIPYGINGVIWYQGENNVSAPVDYRTLFPMMINDWRIRWQQGYFPFLYVQLANYMKRQPEPSQSDWATLREAQTLALAQPNTAMATIIDLGEADNIHPKNKQEVGRRLALLAKKLVYKKAVQASGPMYQNHQIEGNQIRIKFSETGAGLATRGNGKPTGFAIAGSNQKFYWADAVIEGNTVKVSSAQVKNPVAVRYAWADNPECNLINKDGLPANPFRTDDWNAIVAK